MIKWRQRNFERKNTELKHNVSLVAIIYYKHIERDRQRGRKKCTYDCVLSYELLVARIVVISCSMKAQGVVLPETRQRIPLGQ